MEVTPDLVRHLAHLSRLELSEAETSRIIPELHSILGYFERIKELDLENVSEMVRPISSENTLRQDASGASLPQEQALAMAPEREEGFFKLPRVVEEGR